MHDLIGGEERVHRQHARNFFAFPSIERACKQDQHQKCAAEPFTECAHDASVLKKRKGLQDAPQGGLFELVH